MNDLRVIQPVPPAIIKEDDLPDERNGITFFSHPTPDDVSSSSHHRLTRRVSITKEDQNIVKPKLRIKIKIKTDNGIKKEQRLSLDLASFKTEHDIRQWFEDRNLKFTLRIDSELHKLGADCLELMKYVNGKQWERILSVDYKPIPFERFKLLFQKLRSEGFCDNLNTSATKSQSRSCSSVKVEAAVDDKKATTEPIEALSSIATSKTYRSSNKTDRSTETGAPKTTTTTLVVTPTTKKMSYNNESSSLHDVKVPRKKKQRLTAPTTFKEEKEEEKKRHDHHVVMRRNNKNCGFGDNNNRKTGVFYPPTVDAGNTSRQQNNGGTRLSFHKKSYHRRFLDRKIPRIKRLDMSLVRVPSADMKKKQQDDSNGKNRARWIKKYNLLTHYRSKHGHCLVPVKGNTIALGEWVCKQRQLNSNQKLHQNRKALLDSIGFVWNVIGKGGIYDQRWLERYNDLKVFRRRYGHCNVTTTYCPRLGNWVRAQRRDKNSCRLRQDRKDLLDEIGFVWYKKNSSKSPMKDFRD